MNNLADRHNRSYFGLEFVYDTIPNELVPFDYQTFAAYPGQVEAVVTNLSTGEAEYMPVPREDDKFLLLQATCALPLMFPIYHLNGQPYLDGGVADSIPYERAFQQGCDRVVVVLSKTRSYVRRPGEAPAGDRADLPGISQLLPGYGAAGRAVQHLPGAPVPAGAGGQGTGAGPGVHPQGIPHRAGYQKAEDAVGRWVSAGGGPNGRDPGFPHAGQGVTSSSSAAGQLGWRASRARASPSTVKKAAMRPRSSTSASQARRTASRTALPQKDVGICGKTYGTKKTTPRSPFYVDGGGAVSFLVRKWGGTVDRHTPGSEIEGGLPAAIGVLCDTIHRPACLGAGEGQGVGGSAVGEGLAGGEGAAPSLSGLRPG